MFDLGLYKHREKQIYIHRTLLKIFLNPILRIFGYVLVSEFDLTNFSFKGYRLKKIIPHDKLKFHLKLKDKENYIRLK